MKLSRTISLFFVLVCCVGGTNLINHALSLNSLAESSQGPTKDEFDKLKADVDKIRLDEETNLGRINTVDNRYRVVTDKINSDLIAAEFKFAGVGDIVASALTLDQFRQSRGDDQTKNWVQCDGREYPGSKYAALAGRNNVPNLVGRYPRGLDNGFTLLQQLDDTIQNHRHSLEGAKDSNTWNIMTDAEGGGDNHVARVGVSTGGINTTGVQGARTGDETRPKTTIVNFFIRIN